MLTYDLEKRENKPLYEFLYLNIRNDICSGKIKPFEKLPSKRSLSEHLHVSIITVKNAYEQLIAEGYITSCERKGYYASDIGGNTLNSLNKNNKFNYTVKTSKIISVNTDGKISISQNSPDPSMFPFSVWSKLMREVLSEQDAKLLRRIPFNGVLELREAIAKNLYGTRGISADPESIIIGAGTEFLYNLIIQLLGREKIFAMENPGYKKIANICRRSGVRFNTVDVDSYGMSLKKLESAGGDIIHISPSHHYPTGIVMPVGRRRELLHYVFENNGYIIEDDYDSEFRYSGRPIPSLKSIDGYGRVIYMNTFSQTISPSIRISYMILPDELMEKFERDMSFYSCTVSSFEQYALAKFIIGGYFDKHINRMKNYYRQKRKEVIETVNKYNAGNMSIIEQAAGTHFLIKLNTKKSDAEIYGECLENNLRLSFVSDYMYSYHERYSNCVIVSYTVTDINKIAEAIKILNKII